MNRVPACDGLRGVLALIVVLDHASGRLVDGGIGGGSVRVANLAFGGLGGLAVCCFFVMSAYVLARSWDRRFAAFLARRVVRLWPTYAVCLLAGYIVLAQTPAWSEFVFYPVASSAANPPNWSLCVEAVAMLFFPAILWTMSGRAWRFIVGTSCWIALSLLNAKFLMGGFFLLGAGLLRFEPRFPLLETKGPLWLGRISYSLYLCHWPVLAALTAIFGPFGAFAAVPLALGVAFLLESLVERPSVNLSRKIGSARWWTASVPQPVEEAVLL